MKKILLTLAFMFAAVTANAQTQVYTSYSSATLCNLSIASMTAVQVDNFNGLCGGLLTGRTSITIYNGVGTLNGGYDNTVSTITTSSRYGMPIAASATITIPISSAAQYYVINQSTITAVMMIVEQDRPGFVKTYFP